jgi:hypothetical protein
MREIEKKINSFLHEPGQIERVSRPVTAFITFNNDDAYTKAIAYSHDL